jgi:glutathione synthase/RimK-type ligase-like ATP-grasp enzyme
MNKIICLTDYKNHFGSKWMASPYRSGLDKDYLKRLFLEAGHEVNYLNMSQVNWNDPAWKNQIVLYTSSEEYGLHYKAFIEDVVFSLKELGAILLPDPIFLRANNNKVFMEILRKTKLPAELQSIEGMIFGSYDELGEAIISNRITYPCVIKTAAGAMSRGVFLVNNEGELRNKARQLSHTGSLSVRTKEFIRKYKHKGYKPESCFQQKFIIQPFIKGLTNDWKVLVYDEKYFILRRNIKENDFRASGSGYNYKSGKEAGFPEQMLDYIRHFYQSLNVPSLSIDFAYDGEKGYVFEFQAIHFGTSTHFKSKEYYEYSAGKWEIKENNLDQEQVYVHSIVSYLKTHYV